MNKTGSKSFGYIALRKGFVTRDQIDFCMDRQMQLLMEGTKLRLGDLLVAKGFITPQQREEILKIQNKVKSPIKGYKILEKIGQGKIGAVYKARQVKMDRIVALKILHSKLSRNPDYINQFYSEARAVSRLNNINIVKGIEVGESKGKHFFAMEYVNGDTIQDMINTRGKIEKLLSFQIAAQICSALQVVADNGLMHHDVKPTNIMINENGTAKLADLGVGRNAEYLVDMSATGSFSVGTPHYTSPEQAQGKKDIDIRSDIYSLGATLYHMVTGRPVFEGSNALGVMVKHVTQEPAEPSDFNAALTRKECAIILKALSKDPDKRYQTPEDFRKDLELLSEDKPLKFAKSSRCRRTKRKKKSGVASGSRSSRRIRRGHRTRKRKVKKKPSSAVTGDLIVPKKENGAAQVVYAKNLANEAEKKIAYEKIEEYFPGDIDAILEARVRLANLLVDSDPTRATAAFLKIIEDFHENKDNQYYKMATQKLEELNRK